MLAMPRRILSREKKRILHFFCSISFLISHISRAPPVDVRVQSFSSVVIECEKKGEKREQANERDREREKKKRYLYFFLFRSMMICPRRQPRKIKNERRIMSASDELPNDRMQQQRLSVFFRKNFSRKSRFLFLRSWQTTRFFLPSGTLMSLNRNETTMTTTTIMKGKKEKENFPSRF